MDEKKTIKYISFDEFVRISGVKEATIKRNYRKIPGITKKDNKYIVMSGTRYPCDLHRYGLKNSAEKRFALLKSISQYKYISHRDLRVEDAQFRDMLAELLSAQLIRRNNLSNEYGANAYDCTVLGDELIKQSERIARSQLLELIANAAGAFTGAVISRVFDAA